MPIQNIFRLSKVYRTNQSLMTGKRFVELIQRIASLDFIPQPTTSYSFAITYKNKSISGNLVQVVNDILQIDPQELVESAYSSITVNQNPIKTVSVTANYQASQINVNSNNFNEKEFEELLKAIFEAFPEAQQIPQPTVQPPSYQQEIKSETAKKQVETREVFIIMSFNEEHRDAYFVAIQPTLKKLGFNPLRVDEIQHNNTVTKEIYEAIERSAFVVADLTGERPNVYYEVGWAHRAEKEVVLLAKKDTAVHFDVAAINRIDYKDYTDLCDSLEKRIMAVANRLGIKIVS